MKQVAEDLESHRDGGQGVGEAGEAQRGWSGRSELDERAELTQLRKEVRELRMERDILKKATAFFAKHGS